MSYESPMFPIVISDLPKAPNPEGRLLISLDSGELLLSIPYTSVHGAVQSLRLDSNSLNWSDGKVVIQALVEAQRRGCR